MYCFACFCFAYHCVSLLVFVLLDAQRKCRPAVPEPTRKQDLRLHTDADVWASFDRMASRASLPAKEFESWQTATGWSYSAHGLLACLALRAVLKPVTSYMHDYMHGVLQGCMPVAMYVVMEALRVAGLKSWQGMQDWCRLWFLPKAHKFAMDKLFEAKRVDAHRKAERFKAPASEILELYTVMRQYVLRIGSKAASAAAACKAFLDVCFLLDLLLAANTGKVTGDMLDQAAAQVLSSFRAAGCEEYTIKKFHWNFHYGDSLSHHNCLINCFACERKHRQVVRHGELIFNTKNYEDSVYRELLCSQLQKLHQPLQPQVDLVKHSKGPEKLKSFLQSIWTLHSFDGFFCSLPLCKLPYKFNSEPSTVCFQ